MGFSAAVATCFRKYITFAGRARRPEYWWFIFFIFLGTLVTIAIDILVFEQMAYAAFGFDPTNTLFSLIVFLPSLAVGWRRMHDTGRSGWYLLLPMLFSLAMALVLVLSLVVFADSNAPMPHEQALGGAFLGWGLAGLGFYGVVHLALLVLVIWWLTRPTQPGTNRFGAEP